jgi:hypothetical protein
MWLNTVDLAALFSTGAAVALLILLSALLSVATVVLAELDRGRHLLERDRGRHPEWGEADQKARSLLRDWLSPAQLEQYEKMGHFEIVGSDSGKHYRIRRYAQMNIEELDERGVRVGVWCFLPNGTLPLGDIMLAQKIALETNERATLAIANRGRIT